MNKVYSYIRLIVDDVFFNYMAILSSAGITAGFLMRDFSYWWIPAVICFLLVGRYADEVENRNGSLYKIEYKNLLNQRELTKAQLDEMAKILTERRYKYSWKADYSFDDYKEQWQETDSSNCNICGYAMQGCVCKPMIN